MPSPPGKPNTELRASLYLQPPNFSKHAHADATEAFWVIKQDIKMTTMPVWGAAITIRRYGGSWPSCAGYLNSLRHNINNSRRD